MIDRRLKNTKILISVSGGKDSTAMVLHMLERGLSWEQMDMIYMDTGWEHASTYKYLDYLESFFDQKIKRLKLSVPVKEDHIEFVSYIECRLGFESPFVRMVLKKQFFSSRILKWCTAELKLKPFIKYISDLDDDYVDLVGIRREESLKRSKYPEWEWSETFDCWVWRPLIDWTETDVIAIHNRNGLLPNSLYLNGQSRVGCWPCIFAKKKELSKLDDERISIIRDLEEYMMNLKDKEMNFFQCRKTGGPIDKVIEWSKTARGGRQMPLFNLEPPTCEKWGLCEFR